MKIFERNLEEKMKRTIIVIGLLLLSALGFAQNYSLQFNGVDDYVIFGNIDIISTGIQNEYSVSSQVKN